MTPSSVSSPRTPRSVRSLALSVLAVLLLCGLDLGSKAWAADHLSAASDSPSSVCERTERGLAPPQRRATRRVPIIDGHLEFHYTENCGASFGLLRNLTPLLKLLVLGGAAVLACVVLFGMLAKGHGGLAFAIAVPCIVAGALGNLINRVRLGYVVDFIRLYWSEPLPLLGHAWPTINVADMTITIGVVLLFLDHRWRGPQHDDIPENAAIAG